MLDNMSQNENNLNNQDFEDGELPEDGEICDDEEDAHKVIEPQPSVSAQSIVSSSRESQSRDRDRSRERERERERDRDRERERDRERDRERGDRDRERDRRRPVESEVARSSDPFGPAGDEGAQNDYFGGGGVDKDYRAHEDEGYNDFDYRLPRRRRHSPNTDDMEYDSRSKRPYYGRGGGGYRGGFRGGPKPQRFNMEHQICKFFREGYCRDGDNCSYSHQAEDSLRRPILCNFYANSFCKKGLQCLMLHGEFPCIDYHSGNCPSEQCRFSHVALTEYTKPLFEKMMAEDSALSHRSYRPNPNAMPGQMPMGNPVANAAAAAAAAALPPRRRVLLPGGPSPSGTSPPHAPIIHAPVPQQAHINGQLLPPSVVVPTIQRPGFPPPNGYHGYPPQMPPMQQGLPPIRTIEPPKPVSQVPAEKPKKQKPAFNLEAMLNKLAKGVGLDESDDDDEESPASPPMASSSFLFGGGNSNSTKVIPQNREPTYVLVELERNTPYSGVSGVESIPANDPRKKRAMTQQFDDFSNLLGAGSFNHSPDPRLRRNSNSYDSGYSKPQSTFPVSSWMPQMS